MRQTSARDSIRHILATVAVALGVLMVPVSAASAHDSLAGSNPKAGQTVKMMPEGVSLTFTTPPIALGSEVIVKDAAGKNWATGKVKIIGNIAKQGVSADAPRGAYKVIWRVVSEDSHPIEGTFGFTTEAGSQKAGAFSPAKVEPTEAATEPTVPVSEADASTSVDPTVEKASETFPSTTAVTAVAGLVAVVAIIAVIARRRTSRFDDRRR